MINVQTAHYDQFNVTFSYEEVVCETVNDIVIGGVSRFLHPTLPVAP
jgi:hypothetical protein